MKPPTLAQVREWPATVDVTQAASALGVSRSTAYELIRLDRFPARVLSVGHRRRVVTSSLVAVLENGTTAGH